MTRKVSNHSIAVHCLILISLVSCTTIEIEKDKQVLGKLQQQEQDAHLTKDVVLLANLFADTVCQIQNGTVSYFTKKQLADRFSKYINSVEFIKWEDTSHPVYTLSDDGTQAHIIVQKRVELTIKGDSTGRIEKTDFAWTELWKKRNQEWKLYSITSTRKTGG